jgi:hypothetical protein
VLNLVESQTKNVLFPTINEAGLFILTFLSTRLLYVLRGRLWMEFS